MKDASKMPALTERRTDKFFVFVYALVAVMFIAQIGIIIWGDVF